MIPYVGAQAQDRLIPRILNDRDIGRYRSILALQNEADWAAADAEIKRLDNPVLMGHIQFQRLMHPTGYRSSFRELRDWMAAHADHPNAWRVYRLARKRQGRARAPKRPEATNYPGVTGQAARARPSVEGRSRFERRAVSRFLSNVRRYVRSGRPERAEKRFWAMHARGILAPFEAADALERVAASYYYKGDDNKALALATYGAELSYDTEPATDWTAGLANWRLGNIETAYLHFSRLGDHVHAGDWLSAAGHYWAARAAYRNRNPELGEEHLKQAASLRESFYGLIAQRQLGMDIHTDWTRPALTPAVVTRLMTYPAVPRAIALTEIGRDDLADEELRLLWGREGTSVQRDLLALAAHLNLPAIQLRISRTGGTGEAAPLSTRFPLPDWEPADGFRVDKAIIFAMVRQESGFGSRARSGVGARGLMQVMPATARVIARGNKLLRGNRNRLFEPEFNMALGQTYIERLLASEYVEGNLFMMLAAYNGGPGSLLGWKRDVDYGSDPLLFIESIGFYETRNFIERVMANFWLYRMRLGQDTPSLDAVASGAWPILDTLDTEEQRNIQRLRRLRLEGGAP